MISRIRLLRNIGQFDSVATGADIPLAPLTLMFSENGRGKTTFAAVLRSLATGDPVPIAERRRLSAQNPPHVVLEIDGGPRPAVFEDNTWNRTLPGLLIFDDAFVDSNVHSGLSIASHHRQNLHDWVLGAQAIALSQNLERLVEAIEQHNSELRLRAAAIPPTERGPYSVDDFCALAPRADIDDVTREAERNLAAASEQDAIRNGLAFDRLDLPAFELVEIDRVLQLDLAALDASTLARIQQHLGRIGERGESWAAEGMRRIYDSDHGGEVCPFCAQTLEHSPILQHYRAYFSEEYSDLKRTVTQLLETLSRAHTGDGPLGFERAVRVAMERRQFWSRFCEVPEFALDTAAIIADWQVSYEAIAGVLVAKQAAPIERMALPAQARLSVDRFDGHRVAVGELSARLQEANHNVELVKERVTTANPALLADDLARLKAVKARHTPEVAAPCDSYLEERAAKELTERLRDQARDALEQHRQTAFPGFETSINLYLARFNAGFRLANMTYANTRGGPTCTFTMIVDNTAVPVGTADPQGGEASFRNTLSAGDRNTLALALFFTSLDRDADLGSKVVVIDDPISSLDEHRTAATIREIRRLADRAGQVIVLSHNRAFLCRLWEAASANDRSAVEVVRDAAGSTIRVWDVSQDSITEHDRRDVMLRDYLRTGAGELRDVARSIRPHLEAFIRVAYPEHFPPGSVLGNFLNISVQRLGGPEEVLSPDDTDELQELVHFANRFQHDTNHAWATEIINDGELRDFVERTLRFVRR